MYQGGQLFQTVGIILRIFLHIFGFPFTANCQKVKSYIKGTNDFLKKLHAVTNLPGNSYLCTMDVFGLFPNIPHDEGLSALRKRLNERDKKDLSTETPVELAELVLKNNIFNFNERP